MTQPSVNGISKNTFAWWKVALPVVIGLSVVLLMLWHESKKEDILDVLGSIRFTWRTGLCLLMACLFMVGRDFGLTWRFRALTNRELSWGKAYTVDMLCEFTSCVTPSAVGGSSLGMVFLNSKGIEFGRATTLMMTTLILDELFFVVSCPIVMLLTPSAQLFAADETAFTHGIKLTFWIVYIFLFLWTSLLFVGVIWKPYWIKKLFTRIFRWKILRRWQDKAMGLSDNMIATSAVLRKKPFRFWLEVFMATALSWTSRYLVVNALFFGFVPDSDRWQWVILARQLVIWVVLMVSPTPGGSGLSEWIFSEYYGDIVSSPGLVLILAIFWRLISYYAYLIIGAVIVPNWIKSTYERFHKKSKPATPAAVADSGTEDGSR